RRAIGRGPLQQPVALPDALGAVQEFPLAWFALDSLAGATDRKFECPLFHKPQPTQNTVRRLGLPVAQQFLSIALACFFLQNRLIPNLQLLLVALRDFLQFRFIFNRYFLSLLYDDDRLLRWRRHECPAKAKKSGQNEEHEKHAADDHADDQSRRRIMLFV